MSLKIISLILLFMFLTAGVCEMVPNSERINVNDLYGKYKANFESGLKDNIEIIKNNNLYIRNYQSFDKSIYVDSGTWELLIHDSNTVDILLRSFKLRYTIDSLKNPTTKFSKDNAIIDTSIITLYLPILKYQWANRTVIEFGDRYGDAWVKEDSIKN